MGPVIMAGGPRRKWSSPTSDFPLKPLPVNSLKIITRAWTKRQNKCRQLTAITSPLMQTYPRDALNHSRRVVHKGVTNTKVNQSICYKQKDETATYIGRWRRYPNFLITQCRIFSLKFMCLKQARPAYPFLIELRLVTDRQTNTGSQYIRR